MHSEVVITMSISMVRITGPAADGPSRVTSKGTPMKPVFGNAATRAPKEASFQPMRAFLLRAIVSATMIRAHRVQVKKTPPSSKRASGVLAPMRYNMQGRAKNSTKPFRPAIASSGNMRRWVAT